MNEPRVYTFESGYRWKVSNGEENIIKNEALTVVHKDDYDALEARVHELEREVEYLRHYGNKECTVMADEALKDGEME